MAHHCLFVLTPVAVGDAKSIPQMGHIPRLLQLLVGPAAVGQVLDGLRELVPVAAGDA